uniref:Uncharacterized protein n=1 Tax=Anguilla anguilla TaxID=7936 RepID=A0A0E9RDH5_ANGAN
MNTWRARETGSLHQTARSLKTFTKSPWAPWGCFAFKSNQRGFEEPLMS